MPQLGEGLGMIVLDEQAIQVGACRDLLAWDATNLLREAMADMDRFLVPIDAHLAFDHIEPICLPVRWQAKVLSWEGLTLQGLQG